MGSEYGEHEKIYFHLSENTAEGKMTWAFYSRTNGQYELINSTAVTQKPLSFHQDLSIPSLTWWWSKSAKVRQYSLWTMTFSTGHFFAFLLHYQGGGQ